MKKFTCPNCKKVETVESERKLWTDKGWEYSTKNNQWFCPVCNNSKSFNSLPEKDDIIIDVLGN